MDIVIALTFLAPGWLVFRIGAQMPFVALVSFIATGPVPIGLVIALGHGDVLWSSSFASYYYVVGPLPLLSLAGTIRGWRQYKHRAEAEPASEAVAET